MITITSRLGNSLEAAAVEQLIATCGEGGAEIVASLIGTVLNDAPRLLAELRRALLADDTAEVRRAAHTLKSHGLTFGALFLAHVAREIEVRARDEDLDGAARLVVELEAEYGLARPALENLRTDLLAPACYPAAA